MASLPIYTVELPPFDHSDSSLTSSMPTGEQSSPIMLYFSTSMPATALGTTSDYGWPLSPSTSLSFPGYSPYSLDQAFIPATSTFNSYAYNYFPTAVSTRMPSSSSVPTAICTNLMDVFGAAPPRPDFEWFNAINTSTALVSSCSFPESTGDPNDRASGSNLKRRRTPTPEPGADPASSQSALMEVSLLEESSPEVCFGGSPCNRCITRTFDCEFNPTRQRGSNRPRSPDLPIQDLNFHAHPQSDGHNHMHLHAHAHAHDGIASRANSQVHGHTSRLRVRRHSMHTFSPASRTIPAMPSAFRPLPMQTTAVPHLQTPAFGLGFELNPAIYEDADGESDPNSGNPSSAPLSVSNSMSSSVSGFGMGSTITIPSTDMTLKPYLRNMNGELDLYTPFMEDETMFMSSPQGISGGISGASDDADESYFPFTPVTPTIPLPMTALAS